MSLDFSKYHTAWSPVLLEALAAPFPPECIQQKEMRSKKAGTTSKIDFVAWHHYVRKLNTLVGPGWSMGTPILHPIGSGEDAKLVMGLPVTILGTTRVNFGSEDEDKDDFGDAATNAWAQSFKRTCALFGMGLDMYLKPKPAQRNESHPTPRRVPAKTPTEVPESTNGKATHQQLNAIAKFFDTRSLTMEDREQITAETNSGTMTYGRAAEWIGKLDRLPRLAQQL